MIEKFKISEKETTLLEDNELNIVTSHNEIKDEILISNNIEMLKDELDYNKKELERYSNKQVILAILTLISTSVLSFIIGKYLPIYLFNQDNLIYMPRFNSFIFNSTLSGILTLTFGIFMGIDINIISDRSILRLFKNKKNREIINTKIEYLNKTIENEKVKLKKILCNKANDNIFISNVVNLKYYNNTYRINLAKKLLFLAKLKEYKEAEIKNNFSDEELEYTEEIIDNHLKRIRKK